MPHIVLLGTADTKLEELLFLRERILAHAPTARVTFIDTGRTPASHPAINISQSDLFAGSGASVLSGTAKELRSLPRGEMLDAMSKLATVHVQEMLRTPGADAVHGVVAAGGSGNTSVAAAVMQACPISLPKLLVSTITGDVTPIVGEGDICLMYSVVDIAGLNSVLRGVLDNAAGAIAGMASAYEARLLQAAEKTKRLQVGMTMFGVTTPCVDAARRRLEEKGAEVYVFHATGTGGRAMERLVREGALDAVLDITTTEVCDFLVGGILSAGPDRLRAAPERGIPCIVSLGACDMVNFGPRNTVPDKFSQRKLHVHNSIVTLMRTSKDESSQVGHWIGQRLKEAAKNPASIEVWIPTGGVSMIDVSGEPFCDPEADAALFQALASELESSNIRVVEHPQPIIDENFAVSMADRLLELVRAE